MLQTQEYANNDFERCVVNLSSATTTNLFKNQKQEQERVLTKLADIKTEYSELTSNVQRYVTDASNLTQDYTEQIHNLETSQAHANELNENTTGRVNSYLASMKGMFDNITKFFQKN